MGLPISRLRKRLLLIVSLLMLGAPGGCKLGHWTLWDSYSARFIDAQGRGANCRANGKCCRCEPKPLNGYARENRNRQPEIQRKPRRFVWNRAVDDGDDESVNQNEKSGGVFKIACGDLGNLRFNFNFILVTTSPTFYDYENSERRQSKNRAA